MCVWFFIRKESDESFISVWTFRFITLKHFRYVGFLKLFFALNIQGKQRLHTKSYSKYL